MYRNFLVEVMKNKTERKRPHVKWYYVLSLYASESVKLAYLKFKQDHLTMSKNRCAYNVLKSHYSTTALEYYRQFGEWLPDVCREKWL